MVRIARVRGWIRLYLVSGMAYSIFVIVYAISGYPKNEDVISSWANERIALHGKQHDPRLSIAEVRFKDFQGFSNNQIVGLEPGPESTEQTSSKQDTLTLKSFRLTAKPIGFDPKRAVPADELEKIDLKYRVQLDALGANQSLFVLSVLLWWMLPILLLPLIAIAIKWVIAGFHVESEPQ